MWEWARLQAVGRGGGGGGGLAEAARAWVQARAAGVTAAVQFARRPSGKRRHLVWIRELQHEEEDFLGLLLPGLRLRLPALRLRRQVQHSEAPLRLAWERERRVCEADEELCAVNRT